MSKKAKSRISIFLAIAMLLAVNVTAFASTDMNHETQTSNVEKNISARNLPYSSSGIFNTYFIDNFTVSSKTYCSVILATSGAGTVTFEIYNSNNNKHYVDAVIAANGTGHIWHPTLPAGNYTILITGTSGSYSYSTQVYQYG